MSFARRAGRSSASQCGSACRRQAFIAGRVTSSSALSSGGRTLRGATGPCDPELIARRAEGWRVRSRQRLAAFQLEGRRRAREGNAFHMAGCMLYWAEGSKDRYQLHFANSDAGMVRFSFWQFLRQALDVTPAEVTLRLNVYTTNGLSLRAIEDYWLDLLDLPRSCLRGHTLDHFQRRAAGRRGIACHTASAASEFSGVHT